MAAAYYQSEAGSEIALKFLVALDRAVGQVVAKPLIGAQRWPQRGAIELRSWRIRGFPYILFYVLQPDRIDVVRVLHMSRDIPATLRD